MGLREKKINCKTENPLLWNLSLSFELIALFGFQLKDQKRDVFASIV